MAKWRAHMFAKLWILLPKGPCKRLSSHFHDTPSPHHRHDTKNHLKERPSDQAQERAPYTPLLGVICIGYANGHIGCPTPCKTIIFGDKLIPE